MSFRNLITRTALALTAGGFLFASPLSRTVLAEDVATKPTPTRVGATFSSDAPSVQPTPTKKVLDPETAASVEAKALSSQVKKGLSWLAKQQLTSGAWGQGEESVQMGGGGELKDTGNVADTCIATLALMRAGSTPARGEHASNVQRAVEYIVKQIERSDDQSLSVTDVTGTRVQMKIGPYVDTFLSAQVLAEVKGKMPDEALEKRVNRALTKVLAKIEKNQKSNGTWDGQAWAPVLSQAMGTKAINRAAQAGAAVSENVRDKAQSYAAEQHDEKAGGFKAEGSAGVGLYSAAASAGALADTDATNELSKKDLEDRARNAPSEGDRREAAQRLERYAEVKKNKGAAERSLLNQLKDPSFVSGFGSNGGEEFLSYMLVSESLVAKGGKEWREWDTAVTQNLNRVQNGDGSWSGHHCITGRTFVTSAALLVLTADRAPVPLAAKLKRG